MDSCNAAHNDRASARAPAAHGCQRIMRGGRPLRGLPPTVGLVFRIHVRRLGCRVLIVTLIVALIARPRMLVGSSRDRTIAGGSIRLVRGSFGALGHGALTWKAATRRADVVPGYPWKTCAAHDIFLLNSPRWFEWCCGTLAALPVSNDVQALNTTRRSRCQHGAISWSR